MKSNQSITVLLLFVFLSTMAWAQSDRYQMYVVHEDRVKADMLEKHKQLDKDILKAAKDHKMKDMSWLTFVGENNRFMYLTPIKNIADLDKNPFEELKNSMGEEAYGKLFESYGETFTEHGDYVIRLDKELSYMPEGITQAPESQNYRELVYYHIPPGKWEKAEELAMAVKELYTSKDAKLYYRVYKSGFGTMGSYFLVAVAAENPEALEKLRTETQQLIGEEGKSIFDKIEKTISKKETVKGHVSPELSYMNK
ncbi:hypothetical protein [Christiangramia aquimixticola]|uniref:hypothetical protein n=1 Tax=Christiangramia aquimixticola TaxID=1697558 RepID=UPI003AA8D6F4